MTSIALTDAEWRVRPFFPNEARFQRAWAQEPNVNVEVPAVVPGDVVSDMIRARGAPHPYSDLDSRLYEWTKDRDWLYRVEFDAPDPAGRRARLDFRAVDYSCCVWLNGTEVGRHVGASDPFHFDVTDAIVKGPNRLYALIDAAPPEPGQIGRTSEVRTWKPRFAYGWDWTCRLVPLGIWGPVTLSLHEGVWLDETWWRVRVDADHAFADLVLYATVRSDVARRAVVRGSLCAEGSTVAEGRSEVFLAPGTQEVQVPLRLEHPRLWWPNGYGEPFLYDGDLSVSAEGLGQVTRHFRVGVREIQWTRTEGAPDDSLAYTPVVNGKRVYIRGLNWAPPDNLHAGAAPRYAPSVELARGCNASLIRVWGGGPVPPDSFFDACDERGILVWQEFAQSSSGIDNYPPTDPAYIAMAEDQARRFVRMLRGRTCLAVWCGGNELMDPGSVPLGSDYPTLAALGSVVRELDPDRHYLPTSASGPVAGPSPEALGRMHDVHGPWAYLGPEEHYRLWDGVDALLHSELGVPGAANIEELERWISRERVWPPDESNPVWLHHGAWWITRKQTESMFGPLTDIESFVLASQHIQAEGFRYALEAARRRQWRCAGSIIWAFNEAFPCTANNSIIDYDLGPKPAYIGVRKAYAPVHACASYAGLGWAGEPAFRAGIFLSSVVPGLTGCRVVAEILELDGVCTVVGEWVLDVQEPGTVKAGEIEWPIPGPTLFVLRTRVEHPSVDADSSTDVLLSSHPAPLFGPVWTAPPVRVAVDADPDGVWVRNEDTHLALPLAVTVVDADGAGLVPEDSLFALLPGERRRVQGDPPSGRTIIRGFNATHIRRG